MRVARPVPRWPRLSYRPRSPAVRVDGARYLRGMATTRQQKPKALFQDLGELGRTLQDAGRTLVRLTTKTVTTAADETLGAAEEALANAQGKLKKVRRQIVRKPTRA